MNPGRFHSPWQSRAYVGLVAAVRWILRPIGNLEDRFIEKLVFSNNQRVTDHLRLSPPQKVLLIMPRCVKKMGCRVDVQKSVKECLTCLQCPLGDVATMCEHHGLQALVAFRSHIAFDMARREKPDVIISSACHDRMIKALRSMPKHPALLAPLAGMDRMCINATLDLVWMKRQLSTVAPVGEACPGTAMADGTTATDSTKAAPDTKAAASS